MATVTFKFRTDLLSEMWRDLEVAADLDDVIAKVKTIKTKMDFVNIVSLIADSLKEFSNLGADFLTDSDKRQMVKEKLDAIFEFGGIAGKTIVEVLDGLIIGFVLDWLAEPVEIEE